MHGTPIALDQIYLLNAIFATFCTYLSSPCSWHLLLHLSPQDILPRQHDLSRQLHEVQFVSTKNKHFTTMEVLLKRFSILYKIYTITEAQWGGAAQ